MVPQPPSLAMWLNTKQNLDLVHSPPTLFRSDTCENNQVTLTWDKLPWATYYKVIKYRNGALETSTINSYTDTSLTPSTAYTYRVQAWDSGGCTGFSPPLITATTSEVGRGVYNVVQEGRIPMNLDGHYFSKAGHGGHQFFIRNNGNGIKERLRVYNSVIQGGTGNLIRGEVYTRERFIQSGIAFFDSASVQVWFQTIIKQDPKLAKLDHNGGLVSTHPIPLTSPTVNRGLYMKRVRGSPPPQDYFSPDRTRWFNSALLSRQVRLPENTIDINITDATDYPRLDRPDMGAYESRHEGR